VTNPTRGAAGDPAAPNGMTRLGPVRHFRIRALGTAVLFALAWVVVALLFSAVDSFYAGATGVRRPPPERAAVGEVGACRRVGPMSDHGLGFWWECQVHIRVEDGREVQTVLRRSIVSPDDAGRPVELAEACYGAGWAATSFAGLSTFGATRTANARTPDCMPRNAPFWALA
jgi:hypothetical protein